MRHIKAGHNTIFNGSHVFAVKIFHTFCFTNDKDDLKVKVPLIKPFGSSFSTDNDVLDLLFISVAKICVNLFSGVGHLED